MRKYEDRFSSLEDRIAQKPAPDFKQLLKVLSREKPDRPTLFEFFLNNALYAQLTQKNQYDAVDPLAGYKKTIYAYRIAGYDYVTLSGSDFYFETARHMAEGRKSVSINDGALICDRESFAKYNWPDPKRADYSRLETLRLPEGMKIIIHSPNGVLETVIELVGYENLCYMIADDPALAGDVFDAVGERFLRYYELCAPHTTVGALIVNDDWGLTRRRFYRRPTCGSM